jgi:hypothetical protein
MPATIRPVEYFYALVRDQPGEAYRLLAELASGGVNLLAFNAVPMGLETTQLVLYPAETQRLAEAAEEKGLVLTGPHCAFLIQGDDRLGELAEVHLRLFEAGINVYASNGVTDGRGGYGYVVHVRPEEFDGAGRVLAKLQS